MKAPREKRFRSISCIECDDGQHIGTRKQAERNGWTEIYEQDDCCETTHYGLCPDCSQPIVLFAETTP
jgi:hypothetical protein